MMESFTQVAFERAFWPLAGLAGGGALLALLCFGGLLARARGRARGRAGGTRLMVQFLSGTTGLAVAAAGAALLLALHGFRVFDQKTWVAEVQCVETGPGKLLVYYAPVKDGTLQPTQRFEIAGDQWSLGGDILRWRWWMTLLGMRTVYKVARIEGRYMSARDYKDRAFTAFDIDGGTSPAWQRLYRDHDALPFGPMVEAVYGNAIYQFPDRRVFYDVFVTTSGFTLEKREVGAPPPTGPRSATAPALPAAPAAPAIP
jgi:hypothetical protein